MVSHVRSSKEEPYVHDAMVQSLIISRDLIVDVRSAYHGNPGGIFSKQAGQSLG